MAKKKKNKQPIKLTDCYDIDILPVTDHAIDRFLQRNTDRSIHARNCRSEIRKILNDAVSENLKSYLNVVRLLNNNFKGAEYYTHEGWRIVVSDNVVKTIERVQRHQN